jgi:hypothetical protein
MKLKRNVVMLPTNDKANLFINNINSPLLYDNNSTLHRVLLRGRYHHIYITSDEEIKEGDWCIQNGNYLCRITCNQDRTQQGLKKIIATTDNLTFDDGYNSWFIPSPSDGFIKKFIERYNAGTPITKIMVEYEEWPVLERITGTEASFRTVVKKPLKVDKNNCITITSIKETWTREEVEKVIHAICGTMYKANTLYAPHTVQEWIDQNL